MWAHKPGGLRQRGTNEQPIFVFIDDHGATAYTKENFEKLMVGWVRSARGYWRDEIPGWHPPKKNLNSSLRAIIYQLKIDDTSTNQNPRTPNTPAGQ